MNQTQNENKILTAEQVLLNSSIWLSGSQSKKQIISVMEEYAAQRVRRIIDQRDKLLDERDNARILVRSLQEVRDKAINLMSRAVCAIGTVSNQIDEVDRRILNEMSDFLNSYEKF